MKPKTIVKLSNIIGITAIIMLLYWVFIFISTEVFGFRVFRQNMTDTFLMSIMGILALMFGALMLNIMFNLTRIADKQNADGTHEIKNAKKIGIIFLLTFPLIFCLLAGGDYLTSRKKEKMLRASAESIIKNNEEKMARIADYSYELDWLKNTGETLRLLSSVDTNFPHISVIVQDTIGDTENYLSIYANIYIQGDSILPRKTSYIRSTTQQEREYLFDVFKNSSEETRFSSYNGTYELFYPLVRNEKVVILYFSDYQRYGKIGS